jgi:hypothetical protein
VGEDLAVNERIGFDRIIERDWLDFIASRYAASRDAKAAFYDTRELVGLTVGGGASHHNATGKTMTVLARVWLKVPVAHAPLRDRALGELLDFGPDDRLALHWAMCGLAYPFFLDGAGIAGRMLEVGDTVSLSPLRARLSERWGVRGTMPQASQRLLRTWERWDVLAETEEPGRYAANDARPASARAAALVAEARVRAAPGGALDLDSLQRAADLFPFALPDLRDVLRGSRGVQVVRQGGSGWVVRALAESGS